MNEFQPYSPLTELVTRPDGDTIQLTTGWAENMIVVAGAGAIYSRDEVTRIGLGDFVIGLATLGRAYFECPTQQMTAGRTKLFA